LSSIEESILTGSDSGNVLQRALTHRRARPKRLLQQHRIRLITPETQARWGLAFAFELA